MVFKPHIRWSRTLQRWLCVNRGGDWTEIYRSGWGRTPREAYEDWNRFSYRSLTARDKKIQSPSSDRA